MTHSPSAFCAPTTYLIVETLASDNVLAAKSGSSCLPSGIRVKEPHAVDFCTATGDARTSTRGYARRISGVPPTTAAARGRRGLEVADMWARPSCGWLTPCKELGNHAVRAAGHGTCDALEMREDNDDAEDVREKRRAVSPPLRDRQGS